MATISPYGRDFGGDLGKSLGTGLGSSLQALSQMKLQEMMQQRQRAQTAKGFEALGLPGGLSYLDPKSQQALLRGWSEEGGLQGLLGSLQQSGMPQTGMAGLLQQQPQQLQQQMQQGGMKQQGQPLTRHMLEQQNAVMQGIQGQPAQILKQKPIGKTQKELWKNARIEQNAIDKETKPYYDKLIASDEVATMADKRLNRMEHLLDKGSLPIATFYNFFKDLSEHGIAGEVPIIGGAVKAIGKLAGGLGLSLQKNVTSRNLEEFEKLSNDFIRDAKGVFGNRLTEDEVRMYLSTVPTLSQTDKGKRAVIRNMKIMNDGARIKAKAMKEIIKENGGYRPRNLETMVDERVKDKLDSLSEQFIFGEL